MTTNLKHYMKSILCFALICSVSVLLCSGPDAKAQDNSIWEDLQLSGGFIPSIAIDPEDSSVIYAGSWGGDGLFKSTDSGRTWLTIPGFRNYTVTDISIDPNNPSNIWVAANQSIFFTNDFGETWTSSGSEYLFVFTVEVDPHDTSGNTAYIGTSGVGGQSIFGSIQKTTDGGSTWYPSELYTFDFEILDIQINPNKSGEIWAISSDWPRVGDEGVIYVSTDDGNSWHEWTYALMPDGEQYPFGFMDEVHIHPKDPDIIFACGEFGVVSKDTGSNIDTDWYWSSFVSNGQSKAMCIPEAEPDTVYAYVYDFTTKSRTVDKSTNSGETWEESYEPLSEIWRMNADPFEADIIYAGTARRGMTKSADGAQTWEYINKGIKANTIFSTDLSGEDTPAMLCGTLSGVYLSTGTKEWKRIRGSSQAVKFHPENKDTIFSGADNRIYKSTDAGNNWSYLDVSSYYQEAYRITAIEMPSDNSDVILCGLLYIDYNY